MTRFLAIKNFARFQHYRDRNPPWIKLYSEILTDATFLQMPEAAQAQLMKLWVLASQFGHPLPNNPRLLAGRIGVTSKFHLKTIVDAGFIYPTDEEPASTDASTDASANASENGASSEQNAKPSVRAHARSRERTEDRGQRKTKASGAVAPASADEQRVLDHFTSCHPRRKTGPKDLALVRKRLQDGFSAEQLCQAISGNAQDEWHRQRHKHELSYVLREAGKISEFADRWQSLVTAAMSGKDYWDNPELQRLSSPVS